MDIQKEINNLVGDKLDNAAADALTRICPKCHKPMAKGDPEKYCEDCRQKMNKI